MTMGMELQREEAWAARPWRKKTGVCRQCGKKFSRIGRPLRSPFCSDVCRDRRQQEKRRRNAKTHYYRHGEYPRRATVGAQVPVACKCPRCERMHKVRMAPVRPGFTPRIYCPVCTHAIEYLRHAASNDPELGAHSVGYF
jgi:predicted nucleic acid-binding Zn ribbon protein